MLDPNARRCVHALVNMVYTKMEVSLEVVVVFNFRIKTYRAKYIHNNTYELIALLSNEY